MSVADALRAAAEQLSETSDTARLDAELLMAHTLGVERSDLLLRHMEDEEPAKFQSLINRRAAYEPVAYVVGWAEFYGRRFDVRPGVLIPRDDSEVVIEAAMAASPDPKRVLDMGTGSGALLLTLLAERPKASGIGIDASPDALQTAQNNAEKLELSDRAQIIQRDWNEAKWSKDLGPFDLILCNPPYVESDADLAPDVRDFEPCEALFAGADGMEDYRTIIPSLGNLLKEGGIAVLEIGHRQAEIVRDMAQTHGFVAELHQDLGRRDRCLVLTRGK